LFVFNTIGNRSIRISFGVGNLTVNTVPVTLNSSLTVLYARLKILEKEQMSNWFREELMPYSLAGCTKCCVRVAKESSVKTTRYAVELFVTVPPKLS